jgi:hypothetical protein
LFPRNWDWETAGKHRRKSNVDGANRAEDDPMFDYRTKPIRVEAVQWETKIDAMPYWLLGALDLTDNRLYGKVKRVGNKLQVATSNGTVMANEGDWIVYNISTGQDLEVYSPADFDRKFEVDERRKSRLRRWSTDEKKIKR